MNNAERERYERLSALTSSEDFEIPADAVIENGPQVAEKARAMFENAESISGVSVYPFHMNYPGTPELFHVSCERCPDFGICAERNEADDEAEMHRRMHQ